MQKQLMDSFDPHAQHKPNAFPLTRLFPNMVTILGLCAGLTSMRFALLGQWEVAVTFIVIAAFVDGMDGRLARLLNATSKFGAQLDSLSDFFNFGVAPGIVLYLWILKQAPIRGIGWALVLLSAVCMAIRLARFNSELDDEETPEWKERFFAGIPAPCSAGLSIIPPMLTFQFGDVAWLHHFINPTTVPLYFLMMAILTVSRVPTFSIKKIVIKRENSSMILVLGGVLGIALITEPWFTLATMGLLYLLSIPISVACYYRFKSIEGRS